MRICINQRKWIIFGFLTAFNWFILLTRCTPIKVTVSPNDNLTINNEVTESSLRMLPFEDCGSIYELIGIEITNCYVSPCKMILGSTVNVTAEFISNGIVTTSNLRHDAFWIINMVPTKAIVTPESCDGINCPQQGIEGLSFTAELFVDDDLPALRGTLQWSLYDDLNTLVICYKVSISLVVE